MFRIARCSSGQRPRGPCCFAFCLNSLPCFYYPILPLRYPSGTGYRMIVTTRNGKSFDTQSDLSAPERHILQKLFLWKSMASSLEEFRQKKKEALCKGWNQSGPVGDSPALRAIVEDLEEQVRDRLKEKKAKQSPCPRA